MYCGGSNLMPSLHLHSKVWPSIETALEGAGCSSQE